MQNTVPLRLSLKNHLTVVGRTRILKNFCSPCLLAEAFRRGFAKAACSRRPPLSGAKEHRYFFRSTQLFCSYYCYYSRFFQKIYPYFSFLKYSRFCHTYSTPAISVSTTEIQIKTCPTTSGTEKAAAGRERKLCHVENSMAVKV